MLHEAVTVIVAVLPEAVTVIVAMLREAVTVIIVVWNASLPISASSAVLSLSV